MITARDIIEKTRTLEFTACPHHRLTLQRIVFSIHVAACISDLRSGKHYVNFHMQIQGTAVPELHYNYV